MQSVRIKQLRKTAYLKRSKWKLQGLHMLVKHGLVGSKRYNMWKRAHKAARLFGIPCTLKLEDIPEIPDVCPVLGIPLNKHSKTRGPDSPSLDKVIPALGYIPSNVRIISWRANDLKKNATLEELKRLVEYMENHGKTNYIR